MKSVANGVKAGLAFARLVFLSMESADDLVDGALRDIEPRIEAEQYRHTLEHAVANPLGKCACGIDVNDSEPRRAELRDLIRTGIDDRDVQAALGLPPVERQRVTGRGVDRRADDGARLQ